MYEIGTSGPGSKTLRPGSGLPGSQTATFSGSVGSQVSFNNASAPWTPASLGSALVYWFDATDPATITQATGVSAWLNKGTFVGSATQATGSKQPVYNATAINGHPGLVFTKASGQGLTTTGPTIFDSAFSVFAVASAASGTNPSWSYYVGAASGGGKPFLGNKITTVALMDIGRAGSADAASTTSVPFATNHLYGWVSAAGVPGAGGSLTVTPYLDGVAVAPLTLSSFAAPSYTGIDIGGSSITDSFGGSLGCLIVMNRVATAQEIASISAYSLSVFGV